MFSSATQQFLQFIKDQPDSLRRKLPDMKRKLHTQANPDSQGIGNQATDQEACFADILERFGFSFCQNDSLPEQDGLYYMYQLNGSQRSIDFQIFYLYHQNKLHIINFDLKHTTGDIIVLNDGWFHENIIYVVSWIRNIAPPRKKKILQSETFIAFGHLIPTSEETAAFNELSSIKKELNDKYKGISHFQAYLRFANRYKCSRFTPEFTNESFDIIIHSLNVKRKRPIVKQTSPTSIISSIESLSISNESDSKESESL